MIVNLVETIAGAGLIYLLLCFLVSGLNEGLAAMRHTRGQFLKDGLRRMLPDQPIFRRVMQHPLIRGLSRDRARMGRPPSYMAPANFSGALLEVIRVRARLLNWQPQAWPSVADLKGAATKIQLDHPLIAQTLIPIFDRAGDDYEKAIAGVEAWFDASMERVSGWYVNFTRKRLFVLALILTAAANIDALHVARTFWLNADSRAIASASPGGKLMTPMPASFEWPIGHGCVGAAGGDIAKRLDQCRQDLRAATSSFEGWIGILATLFGWLVTAVTVALGAPYFYRLLRPRRANGAAS